MTMPRFKAIELSISVKVLRNLRTVVVLFYYHLLFGELISYRIYFRENCQFLFI